MGTHAEGVVSRRREGRGGKCSTPSVGGGAWRRLMATGAEDLGAEDVPVVTWAIGDQGLVDSGVNCCGREPQADGWEAAGLARDTRVAVLTGAGRRGGGLAGCSRAADDSQVPSSKLCLEGSPTAEKKAQWRNWPIFPMRTSPRSGSKPTELMSSRTRQHSASVRGPSLHHRCPRTARRSWAC